LLELSAALALAAVATAGLIGALFELRSASQVLAAKHSAVIALENARRNAYLSARTTSVSMTPGGHSLVVIDADGNRDQASLAAGARIASAPTRGAVRFYASGFADNATVALELAGGRSVSVVVDQRGEIE
jgi:hypothetical protein